MFSLTIINSDNICSTYGLDNTPGASYRIGRSRDCEIALPEEIHLSRVHCILTICEGCALLTDNNSSNGIYEDDNRVHEILMLPGKQYRASNCRLILEEIPEEPAAEAEADTATVQQETSAYEYEVPVTENTYEFEEPAYEAPAQEIEPFPQIEEEEPTTEEPLSTPQEAPSATSPAAEYEEVNEQNEALVAEESSTVSSESTCPPPAEAAPHPIWKVDIPKKKFIPPPPRKALVKRAAPRPFYTAAGTLNTITVTAKPKELKHRRPTNGVKLLRLPSQPATELGLPCDFGLSMRLLNTTPTIEAGDLLNFAITADEACHIFLIQYDSEKNGAMLVPGVAGADNQLSANTETQFPPKGEDRKYEIYVEPPFGQDAILLIACTAKIDFVRTWKEYLAQADSLSPLGEVERRTIELCSEMKGMEDVRWASAILYIQTGS